MRISVVVPMFNEEDGVELLRSRLEELRSALNDGRTLELVLVDDGSRDRTVEMLYRTFAATPDVIIVEQGRNMGPGAAMRAGFARSTGDIVCTLDADCTFDPLEIPNLIAAMQRTGADIAIGSPYHPMGAVENVPPWRLLLSKGASRMYRLASGAKLYSYTSFLRAYRKEVIRKVPFESNGFVGVTELLLKALRGGFTAVEVPTVLRKRAAGVSKMNVAATMRAHLKLAARSLVWRGLPAGVRGKQAAEGGA